MNTETKVHSFTLNAGDLNTLFDLHKKFVGTKTIIPILEYLMVVVKKDRIIAKMSNLSQEVLACVNIDEAEEEFKFLLPVSLAKYCSTLDKKDPVVLKYEEKEDGSLIVYVLQGKDTVKCSSDTIEDYPKSPKLPELFKAATILEADVKMLFKESVPFCGKDAIRPVMQSIFFESLKVEDKSIVRAVATDASLLVYRDLVKDLDVDFEDFSFDINGLLFSKIAGVTKSAVEVYLSASDNLVKKNEENSEEVEQEARTIKIAFNINDIYVEVLQKDAGHRYPNYAAVIPAEQAYHSTIDNKEVVGVLKKIMAVMPYVQFAKFNFSPAGSVSAKDIDMAIEYESKLTTNDSTVPEDFFIGLNPARFDLCLKICGANPTIGVSQPSRAATIKLDNGLLLIMPVMLEK